MKKLNIFLSSAMTGELDMERIALRTLFKTDATLREFFDLYAIEEHASPMSIEKAFVDEVKRSDVVIFLFDKELREAVESEFRTAIGNNKKPFIFIKNRSDSRDDGLREFISSEAYKFHCGQFNESMDLAERLKAVIFEDIINQYSLPPTYEVNSEENSNENNETVISIPNVKPREGASIFQPDEIVEYSKIPSVAELSVEQLILLAHHFSENNWDLKKALLFLEIAIKKEPENAQLFHNKAYYLSGIGHEENAVHYYHKALELDPKLHSSHYNLGISLVHRGKDDEAYEHFQKALQICPDKVSVLSHLVNICIGRKDYKEALEHARRAIQIQKEPQNLDLANLALTEALNGNNAVAWDTLEMISRDAVEYLRTKALIYDVNDDVSEALEILNLYFDKFGLDYQMSIKKAYYLLHLSEYDELERWFAMIEMAFPVQASDYNNIGYSVSEKKENVKLAIRLYEKALALDPTILHAWKNIQCAYADVGEFESGIEISKKALTHFPNDPGILQNTLSFYFNCHRYSEGVEFILEKSINVFGSNLSEEQKAAFIDGAKSSGGFDQLKEIERILKNLK